MKNEDLEEYFIYKNEENKDAENNQNQNLKKKKIIYLSIYIIIIFLLFEIFSPYLSEFSFSILKSLDKSKNCNTLDYFTILGKFNTKIFIFFLILNLRDIYSAFIYIYLMSLSFWLNGNLKLIYLNPRPFWVDESLTPCSCSTNYGLPSTHALNSMVIFLLVWESFCTKKTRKAYPISSYIFLAFCIFLALFIGLVQFFKNLHSLDQLLLGYLIALGFHYAFFYIIEINFDNSEDFMKLFETNKIKLIFIFGNIALILFHFVIHLSFNFPINYESSKNLFKFCKDIVLYKSFHYESYEKACQLFLPIGLYLGLLLEYHYQFSSVANKFYEYNFSEEKQWNRTKNLKTILRILIMGFTFYIISFLYTFRYLDNSLMTHLIKSFIIPDFVVGLTSSLALRFLCRILFLTNESNIKDNKVSYIA